MVKDEFTERIEGITNKLLNGFKDLLDIQSKSTEANFAAIKAEIAGNAEKLDLVTKRQQEVVQRIDAHIDSHVKMGG